MSFAYETRVEGSRLLIRPHPCNIEKMISHFLVLKRFHFSKDVEVEKMRLHIIHKYRRTLQ